MSQHDFIIDNGPGLAVRTDINAAIQALAQQSSGPIEPTTKYPGMLWLDTTVAPDGLLRQRNQANNGWVLPQTGVPVNVISNIVRTVFTASGTYSKPVGLKFLEAIVIGAGGGSFNTPTAAAGQSAASGGGGGGGASIKFYAAADVTATVAYTVGVGAVQAAGTNSTFMGQTGAGGLAGAVATGAGATFLGSLGGNGGAGAGGNLNISGGVGGAGLRACHGAAINAYAGDGGGSYLSPSIAGLYPATAPGLAGVNPGQGARGAAVTATQAGTLGAAGGPGVIILTEYF